jgi:hypothetical protein
MSAKDYTSAVGHGTAGVFTHLERFVNSLGASRFGDFGLGTPVQVCIRVYASESAGKQLQVWGCWCMNAGFRFK